MPKENLSSLREAIDNIDEKLVQLLNDRAKLALEVGKEKRETSTKIYSPEREKLILDRVKALNADGPFPPGQVEKIFRMVISSTRSLVGALNVSYLGPLHSMSHDAAVKQFGEEVSFNAASSTEKIFSEIEGGEFQFGVVPLEQEGVGLLSPTLNAFLSSDAVIVAEVFLQQRLSLLSRQSSLGSVTEIHADLQSFARGEHWLLTNAPGVKRTIAANAEIALKNASENKDFACLVPETFVQSGPLSVLAQGLEAATEHPARFVVIGNQAAAKTGRDKTSMLFAVHERAGALMKALEPLSEKNITMTKIDSRPLGSRAPEYVFFVDILGHQEDEDVREALEEIGKGVSFLKILGSYPAAQ